MTRPANPDHPMTTETRKSQAALIARMRSETRELASIDRSDELIKDLERQLESGDRTVAVYAQRRALEVGSSTLIYSVVIPLIDLLFRRNSDTTPRIADVAQG